MTKVLVIEMAKLSAMAIGGDDGDDDGDGGDGDADLVQHPLHVHWRLRHPEQRHRRLLEKAEQPATQRPTEASDNCPPHS